MISCWSEDLVRIRKFSPNYLEEIEAYMSKSRYFIEALSRGLQTLEVFSQDAPSMSLTEIASAAGLDKSTAFRFAYTLEKLGYLERDPETKRYRPGLKVLRLGFIVLNNLEMVPIALPYLKALSANCTETTNMTVREGNEIVYVARYKTNQILDVNLHLGSRLPVYCTSMGKAQLINLSRKELRDLLGKGPYPKTGLNTITRLGHLVAELDKVRKQGYAINDEELVVGLRSIAAPVLDAEGHVIAAVNISVPAARVSRQELETVLSPMVVETGRQISAAMGADIDM